MNRAKLPRAPECGQRSDAEKPMARTNVHEIRVAKVDVMWIHQGHPVSVKPITSCPRLAGRGRTVRPISLSAIGVARLRFGSPASSMSAWRHPGKRYRTLPGAGRCRPARRAGQRRRHRAVSPPASCRSYRPSPSPRAGGLLQGIGRTRNRARTPRRRLAARGRNSMCDQGGLKPSGASDGSEHSQRRPYCHCHDRRGP